MGEKSMARVEVNSRVWQESRRSPECGESRGETQNMARVFERVSRPTTNDFSEQHIRGCPVKSYFRQASTFWPIQKPPKTEFNIRFPVISSIIS